MKRIVSIICVVLICTLMFAGCKNDGGKVSPAPSPSTVPSAAPSDNVSEPPIVDESEAPDPGDDGTDPNPSAEVSPAA